MSATAVQFSKADISSVKWVLSSIITGLDIFRFLIAPIMLFFHGYGILYVLFGEAFFYYYTLIKTMNIKLKNGAMIKVYYDNRLDTDKLYQFLSV